MEGSNYINNDFKLLLGTVIILYIIFVYAISYYAERRIKNVEDYVVAGRRLGIWLSWPALLAIWFGAGTILTVSTEVANNGMQQISLDPLGAGVCLLIAGFFFAKPLWKMGITTLSDFFRIKFGQAAEVVSALIMVPSFFGWIAAQFVALAQILYLFFGLPLNVGALLVTIVGTGYTMLGGMWAVTLTDATQIWLVLVGLVVLTASALASIGHGDITLGFANVIHCVQATAPQKLTVIPTHNHGELWTWMSLFTAGALGNIPSQDLMQRMFSAKDEKVAQTACYIAGAGYILFGSFPIILGLVSIFWAKTGGFILGPEVSVLPALAKNFLPPWLAVVFVVVILSAVMSTINSAILSPATVLAQNILCKSKYIQDKVDKLTLNRICVVFMAVCSLITVYSGERAYGLLESAYSLTLVGLFVPLAFGLYGKPKSEVPAVCSMLVGASTWILQYMLGWKFFLERIPPFDKLELPLSLTATFCSLITYIICDYVMNKVIARRMKMKETELADLKISV